ncbi:MAG: hypothetical protein JO069_09070 [Verrucomicrobia bacterium]|nr:hypothetical protein [Verrucomicrobiota bacterium]
MMRLHETAFSLVEVLASVLILSSVALTITAAWRLADYKMLVTRLDDRARRILRECYEMQTFAPVGSKPFGTDGAPNAFGTVGRGYLYHPRAHPGEEMQAGQYLDQVPYTVSVSPDRTSLEIRYELSLFGQSQQRTIRTGFTPLSANP